MSLFLGVTGDVVMDNDGDREPKYWAYRYNPELNIFDPFVEVDLSVNTERVSFIELLAVVTVVPLTQVKWCLAGYHDAR